VAKSQAYLDRVRAGEARGSGLDLPGLDQG